MTSVEQTYKAIEVEEKIDILFYRPIGFRLAQVADRLRLTPNVLTITGISIGVAGGHFFYYDDLRIVAIGMVLWIVSNIFDSADGQLARMTGQTSEIGRLLDGLGGGVVFGSIYLHISLRHAESGGPFGWWVLGIALLAGVSHAVQSAMADYYRNAYLRYGPPATGGELGDSRPLRARYQRLSWRTDPVRKFFTRVYINYATQQEAFAGPFLSLRDQMEARFDGHPPEAIRAEYRRLNRPLLRYYNYLTINGRTLTLFAFVLAGFGAWFFVYEVLLLNLMFAILLATQNRRTRELETMVVNRNTVSVPKNPEVPEWSAG